MLEIQLTALSAPELRRLLQVARGRGQTDLARQLEAELTARPGRLAASATPVISPTYDAPPHEDASPAGHRIQGSTVAIAGLATFLAAALAWGVSLERQRSQPPRPVTQASTAPPARVAVALTATASPATAPVPIDLAAGASGAGAKRNPCYDLPTANERLVCGYPTLASLDRQMKSALAVARAASRDPAAIDQDQVAWRSRSANISDRQILRERYIRRIAELEGEAR